MCGLYVFNWKALCLRIGIGAADGGVNDVTCGVYEDEVLGDSTVVAYALVVMSPVRVVKRLLQVLHTARGCIRGWSMLQIREEPFLFTGGSRSQHP